MYFVSESKWQRRQDQNIGKGGGNQNCGANQENELVRDGQLGRPLPWSLRY